MSTKSGIQPEVSEKAAALLGHLVTLADSKGEVAVTRRRLAMALGVSMPTISRALRELREVGEIAVVAEGGGRGQPTRYRITAIASDNVRHSDGAGVSCGSSSIVATEGILEKRYRPDRYHEDYLDPETVRSAASSLGKLAVAGTAGFVEGAYRAWKRAPIWGRAALIGAPLGIVRALIGQSQTGRNGTLIGGAAGALVGALLAALVPSESEPPPRQPAAGCPNPPSEPMPANDPIRAIVSSTTNRRTCEPGHPTTY